MSCHGHGRVRTSLWVPVALRQHVWTGRWLWAGPGGPRGTDTGAPASPGSAARRSDAPPAARPAAAPPRDSTGSQRPPGDAPRRRAAGYLGHMDLVACGPDTDHILGGSGGTQGPLFSHPRWHGPARALWGALTRTACPAQSPTPARKASLLSPLSSLCTGSSLVKVGRWGVPSSPCTVWIQVLSISLGISLHLDTSRDGELTYL